MYYLYIVRCRDNSLYTGITVDTDKRIAEHNNSKRGAKALKGKLPVKLVYSEKFKTRSEALKREYEIKGLRKILKENIIRKSTGVAQ